MDGDALKVIRKGYQLTQAAMAEKLEVSRQSYIAWEKGTYKIPANIVERLVAGDVAMPAQKEEAGAPITRKNHPECFVGDSHYFTLAHPRWYNSGDCPLRFQVPESMHSHAVVAELATHVAPTMEQVVSLFLENWPTAADIGRHKNSGWAREVACKEFLKHRGRNDLLPLIPHDSTNDDLSKVERLTPVDIDFGPAPEIGSLDAFQIPGILTPTTKD